MSDKIGIRSIFREYYVDFIGGLISPLEAEMEKGAFFIVDSNIYEIYKHQLGHLLPRKRTIIIESNENNKNLDKCKQLIETLVEMKIRRNQKLIGIGGGIIQDITAFTAS